MVGGLTGGCDQITSDVNDVSGSFFPPTPSEAARWAVDNTNPENQRRGVVLLGNASFGGQATYVELYTLYVQDSTDPLVKAAAIQALSMHGDPAAAPLIAEQLKNPVKQVRLAAARGLQRIHNPAVADALWKSLVAEEEDSDVRIEAAIALGQYPRDDVFQALCAALDQRELAVNLAAADSLRLITDQDFGLDRPMWLSWYQSQTKPFRTFVPYYYPTYQRALGFGDYLMFWSIPTFEQPGVPTGMGEPPPPAPTQPSTTPPAPASSAAPAPPAPAEPTPPAPAPSSAPSPAPPPPAQPNTTPPAPPPPAPARP